MEASPQAVPAHQGRHMKSPTCKRSLDLGGHQSDCPECGAPLLPWHVSRVLGEHSQMDSHGSPQVPDTPCCWDTPSLGALWGLVLLSACHRPHRGPTRSAPV